jgi:radical SAM enzyme (rSAM/lipoprotein system)
MAKEISLWKRLSLEIFRKYYDKKVREHHFKTLFWECTLRCNAACKHCGSDCKVSSNSKEMPVKDFVGVLDTITPHVNANKTFIIFTGGECLVRTDLEEAGRELNKRGFPWGIVTNGILLTSRRLHSLIDAGMHSVTVSLDGFEEDHNWLRGNNICFQKATEAIKNIVREPGLTYDIVTCANKRNFDSLPQFRDYLISIGVKAWRIFTIFPVGRAADIPELQLSDFQFTVLMEFIKETRIEGKINLSYGCEGFLGGYELEVRDRAFECSAGINTASILADGSISACPSIRADYHQGNIYHDNFWEIWNNKFLPYRNRSWMKKGECGECKFFRYCKGNGMHLRDSNGKLLICHYKRLTK